MLCDYAMRVCAAAYVCALRVCALHVFANYAMRAPRTTTSNEQGPFHMQVELLIVCKVFGNANGKIV